MKKKGAINTVVAIVALSFLLLVVLYFLGPEILQKAAEGAELIADKTFGQIKKNDEFDKPSIEIDKDVLESYENILSIFRNEGEGPCILEHKPLTNDFDDFKITLTPVDGDIFIQLINKKGGIPKANTIGRKVPCVVGEGTAAQIFYDNHLDGTKCRTNCPRDYSTATIEFHGSNKIFVNGQERDFEDGNLAYKTRDGNVCFFPTFDGDFTCNADVKGLDDDCITEITENIITCSYKKILESLDSCESSGGICWIGGSCDNGVHVLNLACPFGSICCIPNS